MVLTSYGATIFFQFVMKRFARFHHSRAKLEQRFLKKRTYGGRS